MAPVGSVNTDPLQDCETWWFGSLGPVKMLFSFELAGSDAGVQFLWHQVIGHLEESLVVRNTVEPFTNVQRNLLLGLGWPLHQLEERRWWRASVTAHQAGCAVLSHGLDTTARQRCLILTMPR